MIYKIEKYEIVPIIWICSLFLIPFYARYTINPLIANMNLFFYLCYLLFNYKYKVKYSIIEILIIIFISSQSILINLINNVGMKQIIYSLFMYYVPLVITMSKYEIEKDKLKSIIKGFIKAINFFVIIIFCIYIIDSITNFTIMKLLTGSILKGIAPWVPDSAAFLSYRYASFMGHYLTTAEIYLIFYLLNICYNNVFKDKLINLSILYGITLIGVLSTGSKAGIVLITISMVWFNLKGKNKIRNFILLMTAFIVMYNLGFFDLVFSRFSNEFLTTGRSEVWEILMKSNVLKVKIFSGYGEYTDIFIATQVGEANMAIAREYPILYSVFKFGIINIACMLYFMLFKVIIKSLKIKNTTIMLSIIILFSFVSCNNGLIVMSDLMLLYVLFEFILLLMIKYYNN